MALLAFLTVGLPWASAAHGEDAPAGAGEVADGQRVGRPEWSPYRSSETTARASREVEELESDRASPVSTGSVRTDYGSPKRVAKTSEGRSADELRAIAFPEDSEAEAVPYTGRYMEPNEPSCDADQRILEGLDNRLGEEDYWLGAPYDWSQFGLDMLLRNRLWVRSEYLLWWTKGSDTPALVTSSPVGTTPELSGVLGEPDTETLFGDNTVANGVRSGGRFALGYWLTPCQCFGIEADYLFIGSGTTRYRVDSSTVPILARPYLDTALGAETALLVAHPDFLAGSVAVDATNDFQAAEVLLRRALVKRCCDRLDFVVGYRFARLDDGLTIHQFSEWTQAQGIIPVGTTKDITDAFDTTNQFHGGQLGFAYQERVGRWSLQMLAKLGLGNTRSRVRIDGRTVTTLPNGVSGAFDGGLLAQTTNIGTYTQDDFSIMPELGVTLSYNLTCRLRATFGYTFVYWSRVVRPGDIIDRSASQLPPEPLGFAARQPARDGQAEGAARHRWYG